MKPPLVFWRILSEKSDTDETDIVKNQTITELVGYSSDPEISERLHGLRHRGAVEYVTLAKEDMKRRRLRVISDKGNEYQIALSRDIELSDGAVVAISDDFACVIRMTEEQWLCLEPCDVPTAIELGYFTGNLHWRVKFDGSNLKIALEGPIQNYLHRLQPFFENDRVVRTNGT